MKGEGKCMLISYIFILLYILYIYILIIIYKIYLYSYNMWYKIGMVVDGLVLFYVYVCKNLFMLY